MRGKALGDGEGPAVETGGGLRMGGACDGVLVFLAWRNTGGSEGDFSSKIDAGFLPTALELEFGGRAHTSEFLKNRIR